MHDLPQRIVLRGERNWQKARELFLLIKSKPEVLCEVTFKLCEDIRSLQQNAKLHAIFGDISKQKQWDGDYLNLEDWKRILVAGWMKATDRKVKLVRSLDGTDFTPIYQQTSKLSKEETNELIEFVTCWCAENEIKIHDDQWHN